MRTSVRAATWGTPSSREVIGRIAADLAVRAAFRYCAIEVMRSDGLLEYVAVHGGDPQDEARVGSPVPVNGLEPLFACGTVHGELTFVASERCSPDVRASAERLFVPVQRARPLVLDVAEPADATTVEPSGHASPDGTSPHGSSASTDPGAWRPGDVLAAQLRDDVGQLRAVVHLADPIDGRRRGPDELNNLSDLLSLVLRIVLTTVEHAELSQQARITRSLRQVLQQVDHEVSVPELLERVREELERALRSDHLAIHLMEGGRFPPVPPGLLSERLYEEMPRALERAWRRGTALIVEPGHVWGDRLLDDVFMDEFEPLLAGSGIGVLVLVPIAASGQLLGALAVQRETGRERWTSIETDAALDVARDIGRAVLNARAHEAEQRLHSDLRRLDAYRSQLIATVSHELKNPIGVIGGHLEMMEGGVRAAEDPRLGRSLEAIRRGLDRLSRLTSDLLVLSRVGDPNHPLERRRVDLGHLVSDVVEFAQVTADQAGVELDWRPPDHGAVVEGDPEELRRTVANLLSNAVKYADRGDRATLSVRREQGWVVVKCSDTGIGISQEDQAHLFDAFFRSTNPDAVRRPGTGLGLAILRRVVDRHDGRIDVDSELGEGTTITICLPYAGQADQERAADRDRPTSHMNGHGHGERTSLRARR